MAQRADAPDDLLDELVHQFSDPFAFYRELVQNAIDAGSSRIEIELRFQPERTRGTATAQITDWGEGMNRAIIEDYLLTKFRSSKENDLTKIGKFGIGFVSIFAMAPELVVVDTGRDGESWRLLFREDRSYELLKSSDAFEGTRVTLHKQMSPSEYDEFQRRSFEALKGWCRHSEAEVMFAAAPADGSAPPALAPVVEPFVVDAPFVVEYEEEGTRIVAGPAREDPPFVGLYNRGLTLLERKEALVPGVTFKLLSRYLEHTLTRDNVLRDDHFDRAIALVQQLVKGPMRDRLPEANRRAADENDAQGLPVLWRFAAAQGLDAGALLFPAAHGGVITGEALRRSARAAGALPAAAGRSHLVEALASHGLPVLAAPPDGPLAAAAVEVLRLDGAVAPENAFTLVNAVEGVPGAEALVLALRPLLELAGGKVSDAAVVTVIGAHHELVALGVEAVGVPVPASRVVTSPMGRGGADVLALNRGHARVAQALEIATVRPELAAYLLLRLLTASGRPLGDSEDRKLTTAVLRT